MKNKIVMVVVMLACCSAFSKSSTSSDRILAYEKLKSWGVALESGQDRITKGYFAHIVKIDNKWAVKEISQNPPTISDYENEEVLAFDVNFQTIQPNYVDMNKGRMNSGIYICTTGGLRTKAENARGDYNPCDSSLTSTSNFQAFDNAALAIFSFGITALTATSSREVKVDPIKVLNLVEQSQLMDVALPKFRRDKWLTDYRSKFKGISTVRQIDSFVASYEKDDPDSLVVQAQAMRNSIRENEEQQRVVNFREQEARDRQLDLILKVAAETKQKNLATLQVQGTKICNSFKGIYEEYSGMSSFGRPINYKIDGTYYVTGFTESVSGSRMQIRAASIRHERVSGQSVVIQTLTLSNEGITIQPGVLFWDDQGKWAPCSF